MPFNGSGSFTPTGSSFLAGTTVRSTPMNAKITDIAGGLSNTLTRDGQSPPTANLPLGGFKFTNAGVATTRSEYPTMAQLQDGAAMFGTATGTNAIVVTLTPALPSYATGQTVRFIAPTTNTGGMTLNAGAGAISFLRADGSAIGPGVITTGMLVTACLSGSSFYLAEGVAGSFHLRTDTPPSGTPLTYYTLPAGYAAFEFEFSNVSPGAVARMIAQLSTDGGSSYFSGALDYASGWYGAISPGYAAVTASSYMKLTPAYVSSATITSRAMLRLNVPISGAGDTTYSCESSGFDGTSFVGATYFGRAAIGARPTTIAIGWDGSAWAAVGRIVMRGHI